jgi:hypothetical protein
MSGTPVWKSVVGYKGLYEVSDHGVVRGVDRRLRDGRWYRGKIIKGHVDEDGHVRVPLNKNGQKMVFVHSIMLKAFIGPRPPGTQGRHLDGKPAHNVVGNLAWGTQQQNMQDKVAHGTATHRGVTNWQARFSAAQIRTIRQLHKYGGAGDYVIATKYGNCSKSTIHRILHGDGYKDVA